MEYIFIRTMLGTCVDHIKVIQFSLGGHPGSTLLHYNYLDYMGAMIQKEREKTALQILYKQNYKSYEFALSWSNLTKI